MGEEQDSKQSKASVAQREPHPSAQCPTGHETTTPETFLDTLRNSLETELPRSEPGEPDSIDEAESSSPRNVSSPEATQLKPSANPAGEHQGLAVNDLDPVSVHDATETDSVHRETEQAALLDQTALSPESRGLNLSASGEESNGSAVDHHSASASASDADSESDFDALLSSPDSNAPNPSNNGKKNSSLSTSLSQMSIARPALTSDDKETLRSRRNAAKTFLGFLLKLNVNKSATTGGIITFGGLLMLSIAIHLLAVDLIGMSNVHDHFNLPKVHEVAIELIPPDPPEPPKDLIPPRPHQDQNISATNSSLAESWPIQMRQPAGARIARKTDADTDHAQKGAEVPESTSKTQPAASGIAEGRADQTASAAGNSTGKNGVAGSGSLFDQDWSSGSSSSLGVGLGGASDGSSSETERTTGRIFQFDFHRTTPFMLRFYYQTFFQPDLLPSGSIQQKLNSEWTEKKYLDNISSLADILDNGSYPDNETYAALLYLSSFMRDKSADVYRDKFTDMAESLYGRFSFECVAAKMIVLEQEILEEDTTKAMDRLKGDLARFEKVSVESALLHRCIANCYVESNRMEDAEDEYEKCLSILERLKKNGKVKEEIAMTQISLAALEVSYLGDYDRATKLLASVKRYVDESKEHPWMNPSVEVLRGEIYLKKGDNMRADECYSRAKDLTDDRIVSPDTIWFGLAMRAKEQLKNRLR